MTPVEVIPGDSPVILGQPHVGTFVPDDIRARLNARGRELADTDWHVDRLYDGLLPGATVVRATFHRYVIDANRSPQDESLYPGQNTTGLVPLTDFDGEPIWDIEPTAEDVAQRRIAFHAPYHAALQAEIGRVRAAHGVAILWDCHSIRSRIPFLFDGVLPDINIGTNLGVTCDPSLESAVLRIAEKSGLTHVLNGRFKGGWTTRHYGRPEAGVHAIQMENAQSAYLQAEEAPWTFGGGRCDVLRAQLAAMLSEINSIANDLKVTP